MKLTTYLNYGGNCAEAFRFYEQHLGGKITTMIAHAQMQGLNQVPTENQNDIMHARLELGGTVLLGSDVPKDRFQPMRSAYLTLNLDSNEEAESVCNLLSEGGQIFMPMQETFFAHRFAMLRDRFGTSWMLIHERSRE